MQPFAWVLCSTCLGGRGLRPWLHQARAGRAAPTRWWGVSHLGGRGAPPAPRASQAGPRAPKAANYSHCAHSSACQAPEKASLGPFFSWLGLGTPSQALFWGTVSHPGGACGWTGARFPAGPLCRPGLGPLPTLKKNSTGPKVGAARPPKWGRHRPAGPACRGKVRHQAGSQRVGQSRVPPTLARWGLGANEEWVI